MKNTAWASGNVLSKDGSGSEEGTCRVPAPGLTCLHRSRSLHIPNRGASSPSPFGTQEELPKNWLDEHIRDLQTWVTLRMEKTAPGGCKGEQCGGGKPNTQGWSPSTALVSWILNISQSTQGPAVPRAPRSGQQRPYLLHLFNTVHYRAMLSRWHCWPSRSEYLLGTF